MKWCNAALIAVSLVLFRAGAGAAETGDIDGDGVLTLADLGAFLDGVPPAPGSFDGIDAYPCDGWRDYLRHRGALFLEIVRRSVPDPMPAWWTHVWTENAPAPPRPVDPRVAVDIAVTPAPGGDDDEVLLSIGIINFEPMRLFALVLESEGGILRPGPGDIPPPPENARFRRDDWIEITDWDRFRHGGGTLPAAVHPALHLISNGRLVVTSVIGSSLGVIEPGDHTLVVRARLPRGTRGGRHGLRFASGSQALLATGEVIQPQAAGEAVIAVERDVEAGWDGGIPPLNLDPVTRTVRGKVEFRLADSTGAPAEPGTPVSFGLPGDRVTLRVQMRTEVPLNHIHYRLEWPAGALSCASGWIGSATVLLTNPDDGLPYPARDCTGQPSSAVCSDGVFGRPPWQSTTLYLAGGSPCGSENDYPDRPVEYFKPLGEWLDLTEVTFVIPVGAAGGTQIPIQFQARDIADPFLNLAGIPRAELVPYSGEYLCPAELQTGSPNWSYDVELESGFVDVLGDTPGEDPEPVNAGIRFALGSASGAPGDVLAIPVFASTELPLAELQVALKVDASVLQVDAFQLDVRSLKTGENVEKLLARGTSFAFEECGEGGRPAGDCNFGVPWLTSFRATDPEFVVIHALISSPASVDTQHPGPVPRQIGRLLFRILDGATAAETTIRFEAATWRGGEFESKVESGGTLLHKPPGRPAFAPATATADGTITIQGRGFIRGNANGDSRVDLSDAVATLQYLFAGGAVACLDAADADDSGAVEITDAIFLLGALFLGTRTVPAPYPECGIGPTADALGCRRECGA